MRERFLSRTQEGVEIARAARYARYMPNPNPKRPPLEVSLKALGVEALEPGEDSRKVRIRAAVEVLEALENLSPKERGRVVKAGLEALGLWKEEER